LCEIGFCVEHRQISLLQNIYASIFSCLCRPLFIPGNYYGTPKPPAEPSPVQPDLVDQVLFDEEFDTEVQRKRTTSVSKMDRKDSVAPEEEEEEERPPMVNGLAGERHFHLLLFLLLQFFQLIVIQLCFLPLFNKIKTPAVFCLLESFWCSGNHHIILIMQNNSTLVFLPSLLFVLQTNIARLFCMQRQH